VPIAVADKDVDTAVVSIYPPGSTTAIEEDTSGTLTTGNSVITFAIDTSADTTNYTARQGYRAELTITISSQAYTGHVYFDVETRPLLLNVTYDQLLARDARLRGMDWAGDDDHSEILGACWDEFQLRIEGIQHETGTLVEGTVSGQGKIDTVFRLFALEAIFRAGNQDWHEAAADKYEEKAERAWDLLLSQLTPDKSQSGKEDEIVKIVRTRLYT